MWNSKSRRRNALAEAQNWRCAYCAGSMAQEGGGPGVATLEHVVPRALGGGDSRDNLVVACRACNAARDRFHDATRFHRLRRRLAALGMWPPCEHPNPRLSRWLRKVAARRRIAGRVRFTADEVAAHIADHHPLCPSPIAGELGRRVAGKSWRDATIGMAFGITATDYVRRSCTDYRRLRRIPGMTEAEARIIVRREVDDVIRRWRAHEVDDPGSNPGERHKHRPMGGATPATELGD